MIQIEVPLTVEAFSKPGVGGKVSKRQFLRMGHSEQANYLKAYPNSKHRFLLDRGNAGKGLKIDISNKNKLKSEMQPSHNPLGLKKKLVLNPEPADSEKSAGKPKKRTKGKKKEPVNVDVPKFKKPKFGKMKPSAIVLDNSDTSKDTSLEKGIHRDAIEIEEEAHKKSNKNFINKESVKVIQKLDRNDLRKGGESIRANVNAISDNVFEHWEEKPNMFKNGLAATRKFLEGDKTKPKERLDSKQLIASIAKYALMGAGVAALAMGAAPIGLVIGHLLHESWDTLSDLDGSNERREQDRADKESKRQEAEQHQEALKTPLDKYNEKLDRLDELLSDGLITKSAYNNAKNIAKSELESDDEAYESESGNIVYAPEEDEDTKTVKSLITAIGDFLVYADLDDIKKTAAGAFEGIASSEDSIKRALFLILKKHNCTVKERPSSLFGICPPKSVLPAFDSITTYLKDLKYSADTEVEDGVYRRSFVKSPNDRITLFHVQRTNKINVFFGNGPEDTEFNEETFNYV